MMRMLNKEDAKKDRGVSPVIGVILMVAITVILAAVIAAFVLGIGPGDDPVEAAVSTSGDGTSTIEVSVDSADNADRIVLVDDGEIVHWFEASTGQSETLSVETDYEGSFADLDAEFDDDGENDWEIWAILGEPGPGDTLDDADGQLELADITHDTS